MKKVYVIFPALAMLIFFGFWWNFSDKFEAKKAAIVAAQKIEKQQTASLAPKNTPYD